MSITVKNSSESNPVVTLFGLLDDGSYTATILHEDEVPYSKYWDNAVDQVMVYVEPDAKQLGEIVQALNDHRLDYSSLQEYGRAGGGTSEFPI